MHVACALGHMSVCSLVAEDEGCVDHGLVVNLAGESGRQKVKRGRGREGERGKEGVREREGERGRGREREGQELSGAP